VAAVEGEKELTHEIKNYNRYLSENKTVLNKLSVYKKYQYIPIF
jgi:hypothetical protein